MTDVNVCNVSGALVGLVAFPKSNDSAWVGKIIFFLMKDLHTISHVSATAQAPNLGHPNQCPRPRPRENGSEWVLVVLMPVRALAMTNKIIVFTGWIVRSCAAVRWACRCRKPRPQLVLFPFAD